MAYMQMGDMAIGNFTEPSYNDNMPKPSTRKNVLMRQSRSILLVVFTALFIAACSNVQKSQDAVQVSGEQVSVPGGSYTNISVAELQTMLKDKDFLLINTHIPFEGDLPNTDLSIPYDQIGDSLDKLPADKNARIVLYCRSDRMSSIASEALVGSGYTNIWNLKGGMAAWEQAGLPLKGK